MGLESDGLHMMLYDSISKCDIDLRMELYKNIVLSGKHLLFFTAPVGSETVRDFD